MLNAENREDYGKESGIAGKSQSGRRDLRAAAKAIDAMLEPVLRDVAINERIRSDGREPKHEQKTESDRDKGNNQKKPRIFAQQVAHKANITASNDRSFLR